MGGNHGPQRLEDVVDWLMVVKKYQSMQGIEDSEHTLPDEEDRTGEITGNTVYKIGSHGSKDKSNGISS